MNQKTSKLLSRAAASLSLHAVARHQKQHGRLSPDMLRDTVRKTRAHILKSLKAQWTGASPSKKQSLRRKLQEIVVNTKKALQKGMDHAA